MHAKKDEEAWADPGLHVKERRELTVMFADLVGSTAISSGIDAEEFGEVIAQYVSTVEAVIHEYGGHLARVVGDGVLAYFGYPRTQENDAWRACMAGLAVVESVEQLDISLAGLGPINLTARVGIHTGTALLDVVGTEHREIVAMGESLNLAARLQTLAEPGSVVISAATHGLVDEQFDFADLGEEQLRGIGGATHVYRLQRTRRAAEIVEAASGAGLPLVGREPELELILLRWREAAEGHGRIVVLAADAGLGKSRMVRELRARVTGELRWLHARGSSFTVDTPLHPIREILPDLLGISQRASGEELRAGLDGLMIDGDEAVALVVQLMGIPQPPDVPGLALSPQVARQRTLHLVAELLIRSSARTPIVMVLEASQWLDSSTLELLELLAARIRDGAVLLIVSGRQQLAVPWSPDSTVVLNPLANDQATKFVRGLDAEGRLSPELIDAIVARGDGNPMYLAQVTQMVLSASSLDESSARVMERVPPTLHELLLARLDGVGHSRSIIQHAAAIGRTFSYGLLAAVVERADVHRLSGELAARVAAGQLWVRGHGDEAQYTFKHSLLRDAAEQSMTRAMRSKVNARIADAMIERGDHPPEVVAAHLEMGHRNLESAVYWTMAGQAAVSRFALLEAKNQLERGLALLATGSPSEQALMAEIDLRTTYGFPLMLTSGFGSEATASNYQALLEACARAGANAPELQFPALWGLWTFNEVASHLPQAEDAGLRLLKLALATGRKDIELAAHCALGTSKLMRGGIQAARDHYETGIRLYDEEAHRDLALIMGQDGCAMMLAFMTWVHAHTGDAELLDAFSQQAVELCERLNQPSTWGFVHAVLASAFCVVQDWKRGAAHAERTITLGREQGMPHWDAQGRCNLAWALSTTEPDRALELAEGALALMDQLGSQAATTYFAMAPVLAHLTRGDLASAERAAAGMAARAERIGETFVMSENLRLRGLIAARAGSPEEAERLLTEAVKLATKQGAEGLAAFARTDLDALRSPGAAYAAS
ncbi:MAG TPA: adenylate/guanylate cyclase domain-containing protein [Solirubrobacteraceae bacterium]|nr:adenylate/guanylate cyclase domain-containing protein [Solirubrobacteraceae bacterium]